MALITRSEPTTTSAGYAGFEGSSPSLPLTEPIAERFGIIKSQLLKKGLPKTDVDLLVVATALETGSVLVTNESGLKNLPIEGLVVEDWLSP